MYRNKQLPAGILPGVLFVFGSILFAYFILFVPITNLLDTALIDQWYDAAQVKVFTFNLAVQKGIEGGNSISSRSAIRDKIAEYNDETVSWEELKQFSESKYIDGARVLDNIIFARRVVNQETLAQYISPGMEGIAEDFQTLNPVYDQNQILYLDKNLFLLVVSDISKDSVLLGNDILLFDFSSIINDLNTCSDQVGVLTSSVFFEQVGSRITEDQYFNSSNCLQYAEKLPGFDAWLFIETSREVVLGQMEQNTINFFFLFIIMIIFLFLLANWIVSLNTREVINQIEDSKEGFKEMAYKDALTSAFSRQYLDYLIGLISKQPNENNQPFILVIIDIDKFKSINDQYGHDTGDLVLKDFVRVCKKELRKEDIIIRFGGDEFLLIFQGLDQTLVNKIMERIVIELKTSKDIHQSIEISYGVSVVENINDFKKYINDADSKMYAIKRRKK